MPPPNQLAAIVAAAVSAALAQHTQKDAPPLAPLVLRYIAQLPAYATQEKARAYWKHQLAPYFGELRADALTEEVMAAWVRELERRGYAPKTINAAFWIVCATLRRAHRRGELASLPWGDWRPPAAIRRRVPAAARSLAELGALLRTARAMDDEERRGPPCARDLAERIAVLALCGLRQGEAAALGWDRVDLPRGLLTIDRAALDGWRVRWPQKERPDFPPKGRRAATLSLHPLAAAALAHQREKLARLGWLRPDGPVFPVQPAGTWRANATCIKPELFAIVVRRAGVPDPDRWVVHSLRHSFATLEIAAGTPLRDVQARTRHATLEQLDAYAHTTRDLPPSRIDPMPQLARELFEVTP
jgi:integrase